MSDFEVVTDDGQSVDDVVEERPTGSTAPPGGKLDTHTELGDRDGSDRGVIIVCDQRVEVERGPLCFDEHAAVEQELRQYRSSMLNSLRRASSSSRQAGSGRCRRSSALACAPEATTAGSSCAITRPRRTMVYRSPRCSTPSSISENRRDASVAVTSI